MKQSEITKHATLQGVPNSTIDKDWILGHILHAMYEIQEASDLLVFKGGTCIHKCWIENYRFSEDLDFTLLDPVYNISPDWINSILRIAGSQSGAIFHLESLEEQHWKDIPQGYLIKVKFWGADHHPNQRPLQPSRWLSKIHIDINYTEPLFDKPILRNIIHPYSDLETITRQAVSYSLPELLAEKIRALQQRNRPRDIYDVYKLSHFLPETERQHVKELLQKKCVLKHLPFDDPEYFVNPLKQRINERHWQRALKHQIPAHLLQDFPSTYQTLSSYLKNLIKG